MTYLFYFIIWYLSGLIPMTIMWYRSKEDLELSGVLVLTITSFAGFIAFLAACLFGYLADNGYDCTVIKRR